MKLRFLRWRWIRSLFYMTWWEVWVKQLSWSWKPGEEPGTQEWPLLQTSISAPLPASSAVTTLRSHVVTNRWLGQGNLSLCVSLSFSCSVIVFHSICNNFPPPPPPPQELTVTDVKSYTFSFKCHAVACHYTVEWNPTWTTTSGSLTGCAVSVVPSLQVQGSMHYVNRTEGLPNKCDVSSPS